MSEERVKWTGDFSKVAFVFDFHWQNVRREGDFPILDKYEKLHPGKISDLKSDYYDNDEDWISGEISLTEAQIEVLQVLIDSVNQWHTEASPFFSGMKPSWLYRILVDDWDKNDEKGLEQFRSSADWWLDDPNRGELPMWNLITDRVVDEFDEDSFLVESFYEMGSSDDILGALNFFFQVGSPYHQDDYFNTEEEPSEEEMEEIQQFFASDRVLCDFKRFYDEHKHEWEA